MTAKVIIDRYQDRSFYITIANRCKVDAVLCKHENVGQVMNAPVEIAYIKYECS